MPLPHQFLPGEIARSSEVNDNFAYIQSILGPLSTPGRVKTTTEFVMGARQNALLTGTADTGSSDANGVMHEYFQLGWNADFNLSGGVWRFARFTTNRGASALRLGEGDMKLLATNERSGNLHSSMRILMHIKDTEDGGFFYLPSNVSITRVDSEGDSHNDYRLTFVLFDSAQEIYGGGPLKKGDVTKDAFDFGVHISAKAITISCNFVADTSGEARIRFLAKNSNQRGFTVTAGASRYGSGQGIVPLGTGTNNGKFDVSRTAAFDSVTAHILGYWI